ncbi:hypothetical protein [Salinisphaera sp.]|uniref:hypothetical protein n=1 Tax=Salinisphaera sp. TaxID=1914330 RepID=UPI000C3504D4|nr:hypothetical protein [Salinisphaera sp.]MAS08648.1 hypothetical protein [Salinisphaera sp.]|tara:strand:+ start:897 stop:1130 length:234 start_codon:yes stop_codon:yes gene_type:complete
MSDGKPRSAILAWIDRWLLTLWTPIVLAVVLSPLFWLARGGNLMAGYIVTTIIEVLGALLVITLIAKIWRDQKRLRR